MTDKQETNSQKACREWWQAREPHVLRGWGIDPKSGEFLSENARQLHAAWKAAALWGASQ